MKFSLKRFLLKVLAIMPILSISFAAKAALDVDDYGMVGRPVIFIDESMVRINGEVFRLEKIGGDDLLDSVDIDKISEFEDLVNLRESKSTGGGGSFWR